MKQEILVKVEHMNKRFGSTVALKDVSIEVCSGRVLGLIGENGSGKSTLTNMLTGIYSIGRNAERRQRYDDIS